MQSISSTAADGFSVWRSGSHATTCPFSPPCTEESVQPVLARESQLLLDKGAAGKVTTTLDLAGEVAAPVAEGQQLGHLTVLVDGQAVEEIPLVAQQAVAKRTLWQVYGDLLAALFCGAWP